MSFIYSQALVEAFSQDNCSDTELSAQSNLSHTHKPCLLHDKTMEASRLSRFGMMCEPLTESLGVELLTWWLAAFPVKTYPQQEKAQESVEKEADCGQKWLGLLAKYDPDTHSLKTAQCSLVEDLTECSVTLPRWGSMRNGVVFQRPIVELGMRETGFGYLLPTVNTTGLDGGSNSRKAIKKKDVANHCETRFTSCCKQAHKPQKQPLGIKSWGGFSGTDGIEKVVEEFCRVDDGMAYRSHSIAAIGNGQVPIVAATAWQILSERLAND